jgi:RNA polymerase sigma-70 factor, ECF subfamily
MKPLFVEPHHVDLLRSIAGGDRSALQVLYALASPAIYAELERSLDDPKAAEDILFDLFVQIWREPQKFCRAEDSQAMRHEKESLLVP